MDCYGHVVVNYGNISLSLPEHLKTLLFKINKPLIDTFADITHIAREINDNLRNMLFEIMNIKHNYKVDKAIFDKINYNDINSWLTIFDIPELTPDQQRIFKIYIIDKYYDKYIKSKELSSTTATTISSEPESASGDMDLKITQPPLPPQPPLSMSTV